MILKLSEIRSLIKETIKETQALDDLDDGPNKSKKKKKPAIGSGQSPQWADASGLVDFDASDSDGGEGVGEGDNEDDVEEMPDDEEDTEDVEDEEDDDTDTEDEEEVSLDTIPDDNLDALRKWLRDAVAPEIPISQIPAFARLLKKVVKVAKTRDAKTREKPLTKRMGIDNDDEPAAPSKAKKKAKPADVELGDEK